MSFKDSSRNVNLMEIFSLGSGSSSGADTFSNSSANLSRSVIGNTLILESLWKFYISPRNNLTFFKKELFSAGFTLLSIPFN